jgi:hypothetical protein
VTRLVAAALLQIALGGCAHRLEPWVSPASRQYLAKEKMMFEVEPLASEFELHTYEYREGAAGGYGVAGGGCGCN